jgi:hypothetical protein
VERLRIGRALSELQEHGVGTEDALLFALNEKEDPVARDAEVARITDDETLATQDVITQGLVKAGAQTGRESIDLEGHDDRIFLPAYRGSGGMIRLRASRTLEAMWTRRAFRPTGKMLRAATNRMEEG